MNAGTIAVMERPTDAPLESWARTEGELPVLDVQETQDKLTGDPPVQSGMVAGRVSATQQEVFVTGTDIDTDTVKSPTTVASGWAADPVGSGLVIAERVAYADAEYPFPFDLFSVVTKRPVRPVTVRVHELAGAWKDDDVLTDVDMVAEGDDDSTIMRYGDAADVGDASEANIGMNFTRGYDGTVVRGVIYRSGYLSVYRSWDAANFITFVINEIIPYCDTDANGMDTEQSTL